VVNHALENKTDVIEHIVVVKYFLAFHSKKSLIMSEYLGIYYKIFSILYYFYYLGKLLYTSE
jgi:hypothetical protein